MSRIFSGRPWWLSHVEWLRGVVAQKAPNKKTNMTEGAGTRAISSLLKLPVSCITDGPTFVSEQSGANTDSLANSARRSGSNLRPQRPQAFKHWQPETGTSKQKSYKASGRLVKVVPSFENTYLAIGQRSDSDHPQRQHNRVKWLKRRRNKCCMFIQWCHGTFHQLIHYRLIFLFKHGVVRRWTHIIYIIPLLIQARGTIILYLLIHWSTTHNRERCIPKWPLCAKLSPY
jgi:hypothetical protein